MNSLPAALSDVTARGASTAVEGTHYLLVQAPDRAEFVVRYTEAEMVAVFLPAERDRLEAGLQVWRGRAQWTDMVAAVRTAAA